MKKEVKTVIDDMYLNPKGYFIVVRRGKRKDTIMVTPDVYYQIKLIHSPQS